MKHTLLFFAVALAVCSAGAAKVKDSRPNIIFMLTDDQAYYTLGISGNDQVKTPNIDKLGQRGVIFDRHYDTTTICMASRANIMSGMYEYKTGCNFLHGPMGTRQWSTSYPVLLKQAGYQMANAGKFGFAISDMKNIDLRFAEGLGAKDTYDVWLAGNGQTNYQTKRNPGMQKYAAENPHSTQSYAAAAIDFMRESKKTDKPFCLTIGFKAPHTPFTPDPQYDAVYEDTVWKTQVNYGVEAGEHLAAQSHQGRQRYEYWPKFYCPEKYQQTLRLYHQLIHGVDAAVGKVIRGLEELGLADNTVIIYSSDNGYLLGAHGLGGKALPYEESSRAPLIIYDPRNPQSGIMRRTTSLTGNVDIGATILDVAGVAIPDCYDGRSLLPIVADETVQVRDSLPIIQAWGEEEIRCLSVVHGDYKYVYWYYNDDAKGLHPTEELFHLTKDPYEMTNLAGHPEAQPVLEKMRAEYDQQLKRWVAQGIDYNGYQEYGILFDRNVDWETKAKLIPVKDAKLTLNFKKPASLK